MNLFFDIETIPTQCPKAIEEIRKPIMDQAELDIANISAPGNYKNQETIEKWMEENFAPKKMAIYQKAQAEFEEAHQKTGLDGCLGQILTITGAYMDEEVVGFHEETERDTIQAFFSWVKSQHKNSRGPLTVVGHNVVGFDLRFLFQRCVIKRTAPLGILPFEAKPWDSTVYDTMIKWAGVGKFVSQDRIAKALGLPGKTTMSGKDVWPMYQQGRIAEILEYNKDDVAQNREIFKAMTVFQ